MGGDQSFDEDEDDEEEEEVQTSKKRPASAPALKSQVSPDYWPSSQHTVWIITCHRVHVCCVTVALASVVKDDIC